MAYPSAKQVEAATSSLGLLKSMMLPQLFVDPVQESISISGVSGVIYRINGVNASLQEVKALNPQQIARVTIASYHPCVNWIPIPEFLILFERASGWNFFVFRRCECLYYGFCERKCQFPDKL